MQRFARHSQKHVVHAALDDFVISEQRRLLHDQSRRRGRIADGDAKRAANAFIGQGKRFDLLFFNIVERDKIACVRVFQF